MTRRLVLIVALGCVAVLVSGTFALDERRPVHQPRVSPSWGQYTDTQWRTLQQRYGSVAMATSSPPLAILASHGCLVALNGMRHLATVCRPTAPLRLFTWRSGGMTSVVGITSAAVAYAATSDREYGRVYRSGVFLMQARHGHVFGSGVRRPTAFTAYDRRGRVLERLYCASALRGVCGMSAQRRS
jgi:hypothetical protein